ncbi:MAG: hypothetical protein ACOX2O_09085 [Bdellovibrionota bacterium]|jgi:hypothetical protein
MGNGESNKNIEEENTSTLSNRDELSLNIERGLDEVSEEFSTRIDLDRSAERVQTWSVAKNIVKNFAPVPWFIWRLSNFVFGGSGQKKINAGFVLGLNNLLFAAAQDPILGCGKKVSNTQTALQSLSADVVATCAVIHSICRKLSMKDSERIWRPMLDDALLRARIGHMVGSVEPEFGSGKGMLAGFSGRSGLVVLIATGTLEQAKEAVDQLTYGGEISSVGLKIYGCEPLQVSAMLLSACGCGKDAAFGMAEFCVSGNKFLNEDSNKNIEERRWQAAFTICEAIRKQRVDEASSAVWETLGFFEKRECEAMIESAKNIIRSGHNWNWLIGR